MYATRRPPDEPEAVDTDGVRQLGHVVRPCQQFSSPFQIRVPVTGPVGDDQPYAGSLQQRYVRTEETRSWSAMKQHDRIACLRTPLGIAKRASV